LPEVNFLSPSLVLEPVARLPELVPWMEAKWESKNSFPGDHAVAAFAFVGLSFILMDRKTAWLAALFGLLYSVPRLVSGAHWLSDELVGGGIALFVTLGWVTNIPALNWSRAVWDKILPLFLKEKPAGE
jgi:membrane-associated phospholipid phosphatase